jgi:deazaflavin-dependent oxidoreductase (nitroreductase family)
MGNNEPHKPLRGTRRIPSKFWAKMIPILANPKGLAVDRFLMRNFNCSFMGPMFTRAAGLVDRPHLILRTIHWRTGELKEVVLPFSMDGHKYIVVGSHGGRSTDAVWCLNIRSHPIVWICVNRDEHFCAARILQGDERARCFDIVSEDGGYLNYTKVAAKYRQLPVVLLDPEVDRVRPEEDPYIEV